ncbi:hypothetical protein QEH56_23575 [Pelagicoccus enzymogenes]|uniref:hypothetical protein n=1 Tax=Pelagicoccus enzymogenes TaxID=2773457 RepID=UPI00280E08E6|nr:hypothetical protein [Pelagicoccus enzymogenes]MDQ8201166.1 hypothetical protein [Pelagicoccus enzymogenes]
MNSLLQIGVGAFILLVLFSSMRSCSSSSRYGDTYNVSVQQIAGADAASGLDLQAVGSLVKQAKTGEEFERLLNTPSVGVNNLDLDEDGAVDYIKVTEYGTGNVKGFSLTVDLANNQTQEVATIEIEKTADGRANVQTHGNRNIYGANHYYHSSFGLTDFLLLSWLFNSNRPYYSSPWGYNSYPSYYGRYSPSSYDNYRQRTRNVTSSSTWSSSNTSTVSSTATSPNAGKTADNIKAPLKSPTSSQKSFQARNPSKTVRSGGFGRTSTSTSSPSVKRTTSSSFRSGGK